MLITPVDRASPALRLGKRCCATRSHFKGENAEAQRQRRLAQVARPARAAPGLEPRSVGAPSLCYAAPPTTGRGSHTNTSHSPGRECAQDMSPRPGRGAPTDMSLLYSSRRCRLDAMNRPPFWIQPVCSPVSSPRSRLTTRLVWARSSTSTSLGRSCHSRPGGGGAGRRQPQHCGGAAPRLLPAGPGS